MSNQYSCITRSPELALEYPKILVKLLLSFLYTIVNQDEPSPPAAAELTLGLALSALSLPGGVATGAALLEGVVRRAPPVWYGAALACALACRVHPPGRDAAMSIIQRVPAGALPVAVIVDALGQVRTEPGSCICGA